MNISSVTHTIIINMLDSCTELFGFFWTMSIVWYVEVLQKTTTFQRLDLSPSSGGWGRVDLLSWACQKELVSITGPINLRTETDPVSETLWSFVNFHIPDDGQGPKEAKYSSVQHTPSSESFQVYMSDSCWNATEVMLFKTVAAYPLKCIWINCYYFFLIWNCYSYWASAF
jgi:hypothetical protein